MYTYLHLHGPLQLLSLDGGVQDLKKTQQDVRGGAKGSGAFTCVGVQTQSDYKHFKKQNTIKNTMFAHVCMSVCVVKAPF